MFGADMARERHKVLHRMNFESPYVDVPMRLTVRQNLEVFARLYGVRDLKARASPRSAGEFRLDRVCSTGPTASCRPARRPASASPRRSSTSPSCCCSTSRPPRSIPTPPIGCAPSSSAIAATRGATVVLASHNMAEVERLADRVIMLEKGRIIADETPADTDQALRPRQPRGGVPRHRAPRTEAVEDAAGSHERARAGSSPRFATARADDTCRLGAGASRAWCCATGT